MDNNLKILKRPELMEHQLKAQEMMINQKKCGLFLDAGTGKTLTVLDTLYELKPTGHVLIIAPLTIARATWVDEIKKWGYPFRYRSLILNKNDKKLSKKKRLEGYAAVYEEQPTIYFINQELLVDLIDNLKLDENGRKIWPFSTVIVDEYQAFKTYDSQRSKGLMSLFDAIDRFTGLSGTPTPNGLVDLWALVYNFDKGERLGKNITNFREQYCIPTFMGDGYPREWAVRSGVESTIYDKLTDIIISVKNTVLNLPPIHYVDTVLELDESQKKQYNELLKTQVLEIGDDTIEACNAGVLHLKLLQLASGAIYKTATDEDLLNDTNDVVTKSKEREFHLIHDLKLDMTKHIVQGTTSPVLIAYGFNSDRDRLKKALPQAVVFDKTAEMIHAWNRGEIPVLLIHPASAGHGLNFQDGGHTLVWFSLPNSLEKYLQTIARLYRKGQEHPCTIHRLIIKGSVDEKIIKQLKKKEVVEDDFMEAMKYGIPQAPMTDELISSDDLSEYLIE